MTRRIVVGAAWAALALPVAVTLAGCAPSGPTRAQFDTKANRLCAGYNLQEKVLGPLNTNDPKALAANLNRVATLGQAESSDLLRLRTPKRDRADFERALLAEQGEVTEAQQLAATLDFGDVPTAQKQLQSLRLQSDAVNQQFDGLGLQACGSAGGG